LISEIAFTVTPVTDLKRSRAFYEGVLGLKPTTNFEEGGWIEYEIGSGAFAIAQADERWKPSAFGSSVAFEVDDLDRTVARLEDSGADVRYVCHRNTRLPPRGRARSGRQQSHDSQKESGVTMAVLVDKNTRLCVQGITGSAGGFHAKQCMEYGTNVVAGVTPGKGGQKFEEKVPVFDTVAEARKETGCNVSVIFVPAAGAADGILEAVDAGVELVICITEGIRSWT
jgi:catechol 2,3-dioxygenase-like lactoylglutathione lyase family enzyme